MGYLLMVAVLVVTAVTYRFVLLPILTEKYLFSLLAEEPSDSPSLVPKVFRAFMPRRRVLTALSLPIPGREGEEIAYGTVAVNRAGIFIISRICGSGAIENPPRGDKWRFFSGGYIKEFANPFKEQEIPRRLLATYSAAAGVKDVPVHTLLVYTDPSLKFSVPPSKAIMHISEAYRRMKRMSAKGVLDRKKMRTVVAALKDANDGVLMPVCCDVVKR